MSSPIVLKAWNFPNQSTIGYQSPSSFSIDSTMASSHSRQSRKSNAKKSSSPSGLGRYSKHHDDDDLEDVESPKHKSSRGNSVSTSHRLPRGSQGPPQLSLGVGTSGQAWMGHAQHHTPPHGFGQENTPPGYQAMPNPAGHGAYHTTSIAQHPVEAGLGGYVPSQPMMQAVTSSPHPWANHPHSGMRPGPIGPGVMGSHSMRALSVGTHSMADHPMGDSLMADHSVEDHSMGHASLAHDSMGYNPLRQGGMARDAAMVTQATPEPLPPPRPFPGLRQIDVKNMMFQGDVVDHFVTPIMPPQLYYRHNTSDDGTYRSPETRQEPGMMPRSLFDTIVKEYLERLSPKKVDKAVVYFSRYAEVIKLLHHPNACGIGTAQYRYWVKKNFVLAKTRPETRHCDIIVTKGLPVLYVERFYDALVEAHRNMDHAGRDKTDTELKRYWSWMPKEIVADFVRECPTCMEKRPPKAVDPLNGRPIVARKGKTLRQPSSAGSDSQSEEGKVNMAGKAKSRIDDPDDEKDEAEAEDEADDEAWNESESVDVEGYPEDTPEDPNDSFIMDIDDLQALHTLAREGEVFAANPGALGAEPDLGGYNFLNDITGFDH